MAYRRANVRVQLEGGFWVDLAPRMSLAGDEEMVRLRNAGQDDMFARTLLMRHIVAWNITGEADEVLPITEETVGELYDDDTMTIITAINDFRRPRTDEEQAGFTEGSTPGLRVDPIAYLQDLNGSESNSFSRVS